MNPYLSTLALPSKLAVQHAVKTTLAALLSLYLAYRFDLFQPQWAASTALIVAQPLSGMALSKGITRLVGTFIGMVLAIVIMSIFAQTPILFLIIVSIVLLLSTFAATVIRNVWADTFILIGITTTVILFPNIYNAHNIFDYAVARGLETSLGIIVATIIFSTLWPVPTHKILLKDAKKTLNIGLESAAIALRGEKTGAKFLESLSSIIAMDSQREHAVFEGTKGRNIANAILGMCQHILNIFSLARSIHRDKEMLTPQQWHEVTYWIDLTIDQLESPNRVKSKSLLNSIRSKIHSEADDSPIIIPLHRLELLLIHEIKALRYLVHAEKFMPVKLFVKSALSVHRNYSLGLFFGLRAGLSFLFIGCAWLLLGWSLQEASMAAMMAGIMCSIFANRENADKIAIGYLKGAVITVFVSFIVTVFIIPDIHGFWMLAVALGIPIFCCALLVLNPKTMGLGISLPINFMMLVRPDNHAHQSLEYFLNQSLAMLVGISFACIAFKLISINTPYWQGRIMQKAIIRDLSKLMVKPLIGSNTWFNARMADRLILLARHRDVMKKHAVDRWYDAIFAMDLGDEIFFIRRHTVQLPQLLSFQNDYFKALTLLVQASPKPELADKIDDLNNIFITKTSHTLSDKKAKVIISSIQQIGIIWHSWCLNAEGDKDGTS